VRINNEKLNRMTKEQKDNAIELLFEIYDAGVQNKTIDLTGYLNDITKALSLHNVVGQSELLKADEEPIIKGEKYVADYVSKHGKDLTSL